MRIALVYLSGGGLSGGATTTLRQQVPAMARHPEVEQITVFLPPSASQGVLADLDVSVQSWPERDHRAGFRALLRAVERMSADVIYIPNAAYLHSDIPTVCMVRNTEPILQPFGGPTARPFLLLAVF